MSFGEAIKAVLSKYATFSGRARRSEYWYWALLTTLVSSALSAAIRASDGGAFFSFLSGLFSLATFIPGLAVAWRRLHDIGNSGLNYLWVLLPIVGWILLIVWCARDGDHGPNQYGPDPKGSSFGDGEKAPWEY